MKTNSLYILVIMALLTACHYDDPGKNSVDPSADIYKNWKNRISVFEDVARHVIVVNSKVQDGKFAEAEQYMQNNHFSIVDHHNKLVPDSTWTYHFQWSDRNDVTIKMIDETHFEFTLDTLGLTDRYQINNAIVEPEYFFLQVEKIEEGKYSVSGYGQSVATPRKATYDNVKERYNPNYNTGIFIWYILNKSIFTKNPLEDDGELAVEDADLTAVNCLTKEEVKVKVNNNQANLN